MVRSREVWCEQLLSASALFLRIQVLPGTFLLPYKLEQLLGLVYQLEVLYGCWCDSMSKICECRMTLHLSIVTQMLKKKLSTPEMSEQAPQPLSPDTLFHPDSG